MRQARASRLLPLFGPRELELEDAPFNILGSCFTFFGHWLDSGDSVVVQVPQDLSNEGLTSFISTARSDPDLQQARENKWAVPCLGLFCDDKQVGVIFDSRPGECLEALLQSEVRDTAFDWGSVIRPLAMAADALAQLHADGISHLNVNPNTIIITGDHALLADVGLFTVFEACGSTAWRRESQEAPYRAPELIEDVASGCEADIYSFAMVMWVAIVGEAPWLGEQASAIFRRATDEQRPPVPSPLPPGCPRELPELMERCWSRDPVERPRMSQVKLALDAMAGTLDAGVVNGADSPIERSAPPTKCHICKEPFRLLRRRRHVCRRCGKPCCSACSTHHTTRMSARSRIRMCSLCIDEVRRRYSRSHHEPQEILRYTPEIAARVVQGAIAADTGEIQRALEIANVTLPFVPEADAELVRLVLVRCCLRAQPSLGTERDMVLLSKRIRQATPAEHRAASALFRQHAVSGAPPSLLVCAGFYFSEAVAEPAVRVAFKYFELAAQQDSPSGLYCLGRCYELGQGVARDESKAAALYQRAVADNYPPALSSLGLCLQLGVGVRKDPSAAVQLFRRAARVGLAVAMYNLAMCFMSGSGVERDLKAMTKWLRRASDSGYAPAMTELAAKLQSGFVDGVKDLEGAAKLFLQAAALNYPAGCYGLAMCYENGVGVVRDPGAVVALLSRAAEAGHGDAEDALAQKYFSGDGVAKDVTAAIRLYRRAAERGRAQAQFNLAECYVNQTGVEDTAMEQAVQLYQCAAEQGHAAAQYKLGLCFQSGNRVTTDPAQAVRMFSQAADQGHAGAQNALGLCLERGIGGAKDVDQAVVLFTLAAEQGYAPAKNNLGVCHESGTGLEADGLMAFLLYREAANLGDRCAQCNLARCFEEGVGVTRDPAAAVKWYRLAAEQGHAGAQNSLGLLYERGQDVPQDEKMAAKCFADAAAQGHPSAQYNLALCYIQGRGVVLDQQGEALAARLFRLAADKQHPAAMFDLAVCYDKGVGVPKDKAQAAKFYAMASERGFAPAKNSLGVCYEHGLGVDKDVSEAVKLYRQSAELGFDGGVVNLSIWDEGAAVACGSPPESDENLSGLG